MASSMQEALVAANLVSTEALERRVKEKSIDEALQGFEKVVPNSFTLILSLKEIEWYANPANTGKSHGDFIAYAREQLLACI